MPLKELTTGNKATGAKNMAKPCKKLANPPLACAQKNETCVFLFETMRLAKISRLDFWGIRKSETSKAINMLIQTTPCKNPAFEKTNLEKM